MARSSVDYLLNTRFFRQSTFVDTVMADNNNLRHAECHLITGESAATILYILDNSICTLKVFLNKSPNARIVRVCLIAAIG